MPTERLVVWLHGAPAATVEASGATIRLTYRDETLERWGLGVPIVSCSLPTSPQPADATAYIDGVLPEGDHRRALAERADVKVSDLFGLIAHYGRDIAGALQFLRPGEQPADDDGDVEPLDDAAMTKLVDGLDDNPLALTDESELSVAGLQDKMLLVDLGEGRWGRPLRGRPSTHILKRDHPRLTGVVAAELDALCLARHVGLTTIDAWIERHGASDCLIVSRFDRVVSAGTMMRRVHQEDACQALSLPATQKYEMRQGGRGPEFTHVAGLLDRFAADPVEQLDRLAAIAAFTAIIGNADAHGKNLAFLLDDGAIRLAPLYDPVPTFLFPQLTSDAAMSIGGAFRLDAIGRGDIEREAALWKHSTKSAGEAARNVADGLVEAVERDVIDPDGALARRVAASIARF